DDKLLPMYCNSMLNHYLKEIAQICQINRPLVFHIGQHCTFSI
ncbi:site-specific integrase, partial [Bacteroides stercoris]